MFNVIQPAPGSLGDVRAKMEDAARAVNLFLDGGPGRQESYDMLTVLQLAAQTKSKLMLVAGVPDAAARLQKKRPIIIDATERREWEWKDGNMCTGPTWRDDASVKKMAAAKRGKKWSVSTKCPRGKGYYTRRRYTCHIEGVMLCNSCGQMYQRDKKKGLVMTQVPRATKKRRKKAGI
jgi:hypothetical protein